MIWILGNLEDVTVSMGNESKVLLSNNFFHSNLLNFLKNLHHKISYFLTQVTSNLAIDIFSMLFLFLIFFSPFNLMTACASCNQPWQTLAFFPLLTSSLYQNSMHTCVCCILRPPSISNLPRFPLPNSVKLFHFPIPFMLTFLDFEIA